MEIKQNIRNDLFKRNEIEGILESDKNPGFNEAKKLISNEVKKPEENIDVYNIKGSFGSKVFKIFAYVYDSIEDLKKAEQKTQKQRKAEAEAKKQKGTIEESGKASEEAEIKEEPSEKVEVEEKPSEGAEVKEEPFEKTVKENPVENIPEEQEKANKEEKQKQEEAKEA